MPMFSASKFALFAKETVSLSMGISKEIEEDHLACRKNEDFKIEAKS